MAHLENEERDTVKQEAAGVRIQNQEAETENEAVQERMRRSRLCSSLFKLLVQVCELLTQANVYRLLEERENWDPEYIAQLASTGTTTSGCHSAATDSRLGSLGPSPVPASFASSPGLGPVALPADPTTSGAPLKNVDSTNGPSAVSEEIDKSASHLGSAN